MLLPGGLAAQSSQACIARMRCCALLPFLNDENPAPQLPANALQAAWPSNIVDV